MQKGSTIVQRFCGSNFMKHEQDLRKYEDVKQCRHYLKLMHHCHCTLEWVMHTTEIQDKVIMNKSEETLFQIRVYNLIQLEYNLQTLDIKS